MSKFIVAVFTIARGIHLIANGIYPFRLALSITKSRSIFSIRACYIQRCSGRTRTIYRNTSCISPLAIFTYFSFAAAATGKTPFVCGTHRPFRTGTNIRNTACPPRSPRSCCGITGTRLSPFIFASARPGRFPYTFNLQRLAFTGLPILIIRPRD